MCTFNSARHSVQRKSFIYYGQFGICSLEAMSVGVCLSFKSLSEDFKKNML